MSSFWGTVTITSGTRAYANIGSGGYSGVLIGNESGLSVVITLQGMNYSRSLYPGTVDWFPLTSNFNGNIQIDPSMQLSNATSWPGSYLQIDTFGTMEKPSGTYPVSLPRTNNVGNTVNTTGGSTPTTMNFDSGKITSDGSGNITEQGTLTANALSISGLISSTLANPSLALSLLGKISTDNGKITSDGSGNITTTGNITVAGYTMQIGASSTEKIYQYKFGSLIFTYVDSPITSTTVTLTFPYSRAVLFVSVGGSYGIRQNGSGTGIVVNNVNAIGSTTSNSTGTINDGTFGYTGATAAFNQIVTTGTSLFIIGT